MFRLTPDVLVFMIPITAILGGVFLAALKILKGSPSGGNREDQAQEAMMMQDIYHGLHKMEDRIQALETILLDLERQRKRDNAD